jgi:hydroxycarboxylate dehydrogenase B
MSDTVLIEADALRRAMRLVVNAFGSSPEEAAQVSDNLVDANLTGHDSHGVGMLPRYVEAFVEGGLTPNMHIRIVHDGGAMLRLDGQAGFGQVIGREAMELGIARAQAHGSCIVGLGNAHHLGRIGAWAEQAAAAGLVSLHFVNVIARSIVAPFGGSDARFGTNPFTAGVPLPGREPFLLDFATSMIAQGKTRVAHNKGEQLPPDHLIDDAGRPTTDPRYSVIPPFGAILTFGAHKGYGLAVLCELLGGAMAAGMSYHAPDNGERRVLNGMLSVLFKPEALGDAASFEREALAFADWVRASPPQEGVQQVRLAGEPERESRARRQAQGVPVDSTSWQQIVDAAQRLGVSAATLEQAAGLR